MSHIVYIKVQGARKGRGRQLAQSTDLCQMGGCAAQTPEAILTSGSVARVEQRTVAALEE